MADVKNYFLYYAGGGVCLTVRAQITGGGSLTACATGGFATLCFRNRVKTARPSQPPNRVPPNGRLPPASPTGASGTLLPASLRSAIPTLPRLAPLVCVRFQPLHQVERWRLTLAFTQAQT